MGQITKDTIDSALASGRTTLLEPEAKRVCKDYGIPTLPSGVARDAAEAVRIAEKIGYPVVMKVVSADIIHKTEAGAVALGVASADELRKAHYRIVESSLKFKPGASLEGVLIEKQASPGIEMIVGAKKDPQFGPTVMVGLGGIFVELFHDVAFGIVPLTEKQARKMIQETKSYQVLRGWRGKPPGDIEALVKIMKAVSDLVAENPVIEELDLNPVVVHERGASVVDSRIAVRKA